MNRSGFHWFVAWRYLMARPRTLSPAVFAVSAGTGVVSVAAALIANLAARPASLRPFHTIGGHEVLIGLAVLALAQGGVHLVASVHRVVRDHGGLLAPMLGLAGLLLAGVGSIAWGPPGGPTRTAAYVLLGLSVPLLIAAAALAWHTTRSGAALISAALMFATGAATMAMARALYDGADGPVIELLAPSLGLWVVTVAVTEAVVVGQAVRGRVSAGGAWAIAAVLMLVASAQLPTMAREYLVPADPLAALAPGGLVEHLAELERVGPWLAAGLILAGVVALLVAVVVRAVRGLHRQAHGMVWLLQLAAAAVGLGLLGWLGVHLVGLGEQPYWLLSSRQSPDQAFLLAAVAFLALSELTVVLAVIRYLFTFFTTVSVAGVTIGSMALVIVLSVMSGFELDLRDKILGSNAHVLVTQEEGSFTAYRELAAQIAEVPGVVASTPYLTSEVVIAANSNYSNVIIKGVDPATVGAVTELSDNIEQPGAIERLYPLGEDGAVLGPPRDAGVDQPGGDDDGSPASGLDPPPDDMPLDWDEPVDFSGDEPADSRAPEADEPDATPPAPQVAPEAVEAGEPEAAPDTDEAMIGAADPPPADMDMDWGEPADFSGEAGASAGLEVSDYRVGAGRAPSDDRPSGDPLVHPADPLFDVPSFERLQALEAEAALKGEAARPEDQDHVGDEDPTPRRTPAVRLSPRVARLPGVLVGKELVKQIHLYVGQEVRIISPIPEDTPAGPVPRTRYLRVAGSFFTGMYEYDFKYVYVSLDTLQGFLDLPDEVSGIEIRVADPIATEPVLAALRQTLPPGYLVQDWKEINRNLFSALKLEKIAMFLVLAIIILVASFSIVSNLIMVVVEKAKEIALLKTLGAGNAGVMRIFVIQGFFIGVTGTSLGVIHGLVACVLGNVYGLPLDPEVYYIDQLPIHIESLAVLAVAFAGIAISVVATLYPAAVAARLRPMEGLRYD
ncbi:FtsX-like permease family protein [Haliangium sp.]|uniref:FtsX-like permease family protein n=1 Tax=Haliangium sp. TaxID=2663208 RepID=UPI003D0DD847